MKIGICDTGAMGMAIATRLIDQGHDIAVADATLSVYDAAEKDS